MRSGLEACGTRVISAGRRSLRLLLAGNRALRTLAGARVGLGALTADREAHAVTATLVAADLDLAADVRLDLTPEVTLDLEVGFDLVAKLDQLLVTERVDPGVRVDAGGSEQLLGAGTADAVDVGECDLDALVAREVHTNEACHVVWRSLRVVHSGFGRVAPRRLPDGCRDRAPATAPEVISPGVRRASEHVVVVQLCASGKSLSLASACGAGSHRSP